MRTENKIVVAVADDDIEDHELMRTGLQECNVLVEVDALFNGLQLMDYLLGREIYKNMKKTPSLILLDLRMPLMDGFGVLQEIRQFPHLKEIPIYVVTVSGNKKDR